MFTTVTGFVVVSWDLLNLLAVDGGVLWADTTIPIEIVFLVVRCSQNPDKSSKNAEGRQLAARFQPQNTNAKEAQREQPQSAVF